MKRAEFEIKENGHHCFEVFDNSRNDEWIATFSFFHDALNFVKLRQRLPYDTSAVSLQDRGQS